MNEPDVLEMIMEYQNLEKEDKDAIKQIIFSLSKKSKA